MFVDVGFSLLATLCLFWYSGFLPWGQNPIVILSFIIFAFIFLVAICESRYPFIPILFATHLYLKNVHDFSMITYAINHPLETILYIFGYIVIGLIWSLIKFRLEVRQDQHNSKFTGINEDNIIAFAKNYVTKKKSLIFDWIIFWPLSVLSSIFGDFLKELLEWFYGLLYNHLVNIVIGVIKPSGIGQIVSRPRTNLQSDQIDQRPH